eukprot:m.77631 g.77631  ORF g.77631 m.77631 type:complete len:263 (-) comp14477_c0_seq1:2442-3230(-)
MTERICYYELLGIERSATGADIKKAYRKAALIHHPDKNPGQEEQAASMFKLVSEAYDVLSDPDKRDVYDRYGHDGLKAGGGGRPRQSASGPQFHFRNPADLFREVFGDPFSHGGASPFDSFPSPFQDPFFGGMSPHQSARSGGGSVRPFGDSMFGGSMFGGSMFGGDPFNDPFFGGGGMMGSSMHSSFSSGGLSGGSYSQSTRTSIRDGKQHTTTTTVENGVSSERVEVRDTRTGKLLDLHINGRQQDVGQLGNGSSMPALS